MGWDGAVINPGQGLGRQPQAQHQAPAGGQPQGLQWWARLPTPSQHPRQLLQPLQLAAGRGLVLRLRLTPQSLAWIDHCPISSHPIESPT